MFISPLVPAAIAPLQLLVLPVLAESSSPSSVVPTRNHINTIAGYDQLSTCAQNVLSTLVRAQASGCADDGALASYACFCTDSSSRFRSDITSAVSVTCDPAIASEQAASAIHVFDAYCALGVDAGLANTTAPSTASTTGTASPAASALSTTATAAATAAATATPSAGVKTTTAKRTTTTGSASAQGPAVVNSAIIAAAVIVPVCAIALGLMWCFLWRRRRRQHTRGGDGTEKQRELEDMPSREAPPRRLETVRATTEFKWPARMGDASSRLTLQEVQYIQPPPQQHHPHHQQQQHIQQEQQQQQQQQQQRLHQLHPLHHPQPQQLYQQHQNQDSQQHLHPRGADAPEKELFVSSPTAASFLSSTGTSTLLPPHYNPEYHISPQAYAQQQQQDANGSIHSSQTTHHDLDLLKHKYPAQGLHQTEPAELPHHDLPELYQLEKQDKKQQQPLPQELPATAVVLPPAPALLLPQELDGSVVSLASPPPPRSRFSFQT